jgi:hypothetical protein
VGEKIGQENEGVVKVGEIHEECEGGGSLGPFLVVGQRGKDVDSNERQCQFM